MIMKRNTSIRPIQNRQEIDNKDKESTIYLYGDIGGWSGIDNAEWVKEFNAFTADTIHLRIDSGGGDIFAARTIKTAIVQHKSKVIGHIDGLAASAASFLLMGCDEIEIVDGGFLMIHNAASYMDIYGYFNLKALEDIRDEIDREMTLHAKLNDSIANDYVKKSGGDKDDFIQWMDDETWFTADEALEAGLVDSIYDGEPVEGSYDFSVFNKVPEILALRNKKDEKREIEKVLRDGGLSNKRAKTILSKGFQDESSDTEDSRDGDASTQRDGAPVVDEQELVICQGCGKSIDYENTPEEGMGYIKCPECGELINQEGKVVNKEKPRDRMAVMLAKIETFVPSVYEPMADN